MTKVHGVETAVETTVIVWGDRHFPARIVQEQCRALQDSGVVDGVMFADQLVNFIPIQLWNERNTPMAKIMRDPDSHSDAFAIAGYAFAAAPKLNITLSTDSVRRPPVELIQSMLTLANITEGRASFHIGAGENKQCQPYGHNRAQGVGRLEELFRMFELLVNSGGRPIDFHGKYRVLDKASIGSAFPYRPQIWGLGGGPKLMEHTIRYADGLAVTAPIVWASGEQAAKVVADVRRRLAAIGRDPAKFRFGAWCPALVHPDPQVLEQACHNRLVRFMTGIFGRIHMPDWETEGLAMPAPADWSYFKDLLPYNTDDRFIEDVIAEVTPAHVRKGWFMGSPEQVAAQMKPFVDAGVDWILPLDYLPLIREPDDAPAGFARTVELCAALKRITTQ